MKSDMTNFCKALMLVLVTVACACNAETPAAPTRSAIVTFAVGNEQFRVLLNGDKQIDAAWAAHTGGSARIPIGRIAAGSQVNSGWSWHLQDIAFAEATIELCDGRPSDVERVGLEFGGGRYCPWTATIDRIEIR